jgi:Flp pilus assembly protein TadG
MSRKLRRPRNFAEGAANPAARLTAQAFARGAAMVRMFLGRDETGAAAVEFAILTPVFLVMLFGMIAYGIYFGAAHSVQQLAADAARTSVAGLSPGERDELVTGFISRNAGDYVLIDPQKLSVSIGDKPDDPDQYRVTVSYDASALPIWNLDVPLPLPGRTITYSSVVRRGGV